MIAVAHNDHAICIASGQELKMKTFVIFFFLCMASIGITHAENQKPLGHWVELVTTDGAVAFHVYHYHAPEGQRVAGQNPRAPRTTKAVAYHRSAATTYERPINGATQAVSKGYDGAYKSPDKLHFDWLPGGPCDENKKVLLDVYWRIDGKLELRGKREACVPRSILWTPKATPPGRHEWIPDCDRK